MTTIYNVRYIHYLYDFTKDIIGSFIDYVMFAKGNFDLFVM